MPFGASTIRVAFLAPTPHPAGTHYPLEKAGDAIQETAKPKRGGKCFIEG